MFIVHPVVNLGMCIISGTRQSSKRSFIPKKLRSGKVCPLPNGFQAITVKYSRSAVMSSLLQLSMWSVAHFVPKVPSPTLTRSHLKPE